MPIELPPLISSYLLCVRAPLNLVGPLQALASEPPAKWAAPTAQGLVLVECDLDLPGSGGATCAAGSSQTRAADSAKAPLTSPSLTDKRFVHMPPFEQPRKSCAQAEKPTVDSGWGPRPDVGLGRPRSQVHGGYQQKSASAAQPGGCNGGGSMSSAALSREAADSRGQSSLPARQKRPPQPLNANGSTKRRQPELLSASRLLAIAASGRKGSGMSSAGMSNGQLPSVSQCANTGQPEKRAILPGGMYCEKRAQERGQGGEGVRMRVSGRSPVQLAKEYTMLMETDIFS